MASYTFMREVTMRPGAASRILRTTLRKKRERFSKDGPP